MLRNGVRDRAGGVLLLGRVLRSLPQSHADALLLLNAMFLLRFTWSVIEFDAALQ